MDDAGPEGGMRLRFSGETGLFKRLGAHRPTIAHWGMELVIVVGGVLIALGAGELVQDLNWKEQVNEARGAMNTQLLDSKFAAMERIKASECLDRKLDRLDTLIAQPAMPEVDLANLGPLRLWSTFSWDAASASGAVARMTPEIRNIYAQLFSLTDVIGDLNQKEYETGASIRTLERHRELTETSRDRLAQDISRLRSTNRIMTLAAHQWLKRAEPLKLRLEEEDYKLLREPPPCRLPDETGKS